MKTWECVYRYEDMGMCVGYEDMGMCVGYEDMGMCVGYEDMRMCVGMYSWITYNYTNAVKRCLQ